MKGTHFGGIETINEVATAELRRIPEESFQQCMEGWRERMDKDSRAITLRGTDHDFDNICVMKLL